jgi:hypothetical protein
MYARVCVYMCCSDKAHTICPHHALPRRAQEQLRVTQVQLHVRQEQLLADAEKTRTRVREEAEHAHALARETLEGERHSLAAAEKSFELEVRIALCSKRGVNEWGTCAIAVHVCLAWL